MNSWSYSRTITELPMPSSAIKIVEDMAEKQGIEGLKFTKRKSKHKSIPPVDHIAGVEYEENNENDDVYQDEETSYEEDDDFDDQESYKNLDQEELDNILLDAKSDKPTL